MWFAIISSILCFVTAFMLLKYETTFLCQPMSYFFLIEGTWTLFSFIFNKIWPTNQFMTIINYVYKSIFAAILIYSLHKHSKNN